MERVRDDYESRKVTGRPGTMPLPWARTWTGSGTIPAAGAAPTWPSCPAGQPDL